MVGGVPGAAEVKVGWANLFLASLSLTCPLGPEISSILGEP